MGVPRNSLACMLETEVVHFMSFDDLLLYAINKLDSDMEFEFQSDEVYDGRSGGYTDGSVSIQEKAGRRKAKSIGGGKSE